MLEKNLRYLLQLNRILQALHTSFNEWAMVAALTDDPRPVSENSLAMILNMPRTTARGYIEDGIAMGLIVRNKNHTIEPVQEKWVSVVKILTEAFDIMENKEPGFSPLVIELIKDLHFNSTKKSKKNLNLEQLLNIN